MESEAILVTNQTIPRLTLAKLAKDSVLVTNILDTEVDLWVEIHQLEEFFNGTVPNKD